LRDIYDDLFVLMLCNLLWAVIGGPLLVLALGLFGTGLWIPAVVALLVAGVPLGLASAGLAAVSYRISDGLATSTRDFFAGMRRYAAPAMRVMVAWCAVLAVILVDIAFYSAMASLVGSVMTVFWLYLLVLWFGVLIYLFPLLMIQEHPRLRTLARNALILTLGRPIFTLITLVLMAIIVAITLIVPLLPLFFTFALLSQWGARATLLLVADSEARRAARAQADAETEAALPADKGRHGQIKPK
jgi:uncharacterized membrane protein YesL